MVSWVTMIECFPYGLMIKQEAQTSLIWIGKPQVGGCIGLKNGI